VRGSEDVKITLNTGIQLGRALRCFHELSNACQLLISVQEICEANLIRKNSCAIQCAHELSMVYCAQRNFEECEPLARLVWDNKATSNISSTRDVSTALDLENGECLATALRGLNKILEARDFSAQYIKLYPNSSERTTHEQSRLQNSSPRSSWNWKTNTRWRRVSNQR
jgi:hypothetical protein